MATAIMDSGAKAVRKELSKVWSGKASDRLEDKLTAAADLLKDIPVSQGIAHIAAELESYSRVTLESLPKRVIITP